MKNISENFYASKLAQRTFKKNNSLLILAICTHGITADEQAQTSNKLWAKVIYPWRKEKNLKLHIRVPICLFIWKSNEKTNALFVNSAFFFASYRKFVWWMGGFSGALNSANRYLMYDIKLIYENKTGVHTYFFSGLNICDCFWFCFVSFCFFFFFFTLYHFSFYSLE